LTQHSPTEPVMYTKMNWPASHIREPRTNAGSNKGASKGTSKMQFMDKIVSRCLHVGQTIFMQLRRTLHM